MVQEKDGSLWGRKLAYLTEKMVDGACRADKMIGEERTQRNSKARRFVQILQSTSFVPI